MGDAIVVSPTLVVDVRYGLSRINTKNLSRQQGRVQRLPGLRHPGQRAGDHGAAGLRAGGQSERLYRRQRRRQQLVGVVGRNFGTKREYQTNHSLTGSITKVRGRWNHKAGLEYRNLLSNYWDLEQASVAMPSPFAHSGGNFNFQYTTASGGVASLVTTNAQRGVNAAAMLLGTGVWWIRPGANVQPALAQKYFAVYSQNDWRASSKLTINLGLRWEVQPGPTERFNRMSAWDFEATNAFGTKGAIAFPGVDGYSRNLWDTTYDNWGPRVGAAYSVNDRTVLRGGFGITYLPSNTGYFSGPTDYGSANFSAGVTQTAYGTTPRGVPVIRFSDPAPIAPAIGGDPTAPQVYGIGEARFDRHFKNGQARQWNLFIERALFKNWMASIGYTASVSRNLFNRSYPIQNLQSIPADTLAQWRDQYIASNGTLNPSTQLVPNPFQPASGPLLPFAGALGAATIARQNTLFPYPLLIGSNAAVDRSGATADYHAMVLRVSRRFAGGVMMDATYTWSKEIDNTDNMEDNQNFNAGGGARGNNHSLTDPASIDGLATAMCRTGWSGCSSTISHSERASPWKHRRRCCARSSAAGRSVDH